jgi:1-acyl-sn-glycerol-3-phosphate acyltransferase
MRPSANATPSRLWSRLPKPLTWLVFQTHLLLLAVGSLAGNAVAAVLYWVLPPAWARRFGRAFIALGYRLFFAISRGLRILYLDTQALDALAAQPGLVIVANHPCLLDAVVIVARLPRVACVMKASLLRNPLLGAGALLARYIPNDSAHHMVRGAVDDLRAGGQLLLFPEGTRTVHGVLNPFQPSFAVIAKHARVPIQTVFIETDTPYSRKGWPLWRLPPLPIVLQLRLGRRFEPQADHMALMQEMQAYYLAELSGPGRRATDPSGLTAPPAASAAPAPPASSTTPKSTLS